MRYDRGYFRGKRAIASLTTGAPASVLGPGSRGGDIDALLYPIQYSLYYMGFSVLPAFVAAGVQGHGFGSQGESAFGRQLETYQHEWAQRLADLDRTDALDFPGWDDWDETGRLKSPESSHGSGKPPAFAARPPAYALSR